MLELVDFTEQERLMLLEKEAGLEEELVKTVGRAEAAEARLTGSRQEVQQLEQQLGECKQQVRGLKWECRVGFGFQGSNCLSPLVCTPLHPAADCVWASPPTVVWLGDCSQEPCVDGKVCLAMGLAGLAY